MLCQTRPWTPWPTREDMAGLLEKCATSAAMHTDRLCSARSLGTILSSLKMWTSPLLAVQCSYQATGAWKTVCSKVPCLHQSQKISQEVQGPWSPGASRGGGHGGSSSSPFHSQSLWLAGGRRLFLQGLVGPIHRQSFGPAGRAFGKSSRLSS